ncbi:cell division protein FtsL [Sporosarcina sp. ANT_H38]|uniref:cell division protein FtsL n=1 Tax=Sporosarcina sp. ANT_H38 TaxID=2597358 RepID=UPI0011F2FA3E|nr:cell division protein FtsL [Sporosarcina sp. ANT_H38]KAA0966605.1 cell division protein FtsL [Sporosarcina sp. ANT_H38]
MALEQRKFQTSYIRELETPVVPRKQPQVRPSRKVFSVGEKFLFVLFATILVLFLTVILQGQAQINDTNREVQLLEKDISEITKQNMELSIQVKEKSTYDRIWKKAKELGLNPNENNVKVVSGR